MGPMPRKRRETLAPEVQVRVEERSLGGLKELSGCCCCCCFMVFCSMDFLYVFVGIDFGELIQS